METERSAGRDRSLEGATQAGHDLFSLRTHLDHIVNSPQFRHSKRCQSLLRFVVEETLEGRGELLKERVVGAQVFGRELAYDTAQDPIVRNAANEVRKRLAQYYLASDTMGVLRIQLPPGSYVPEFKPDSQAPPAEARESVTESADEAPAYRARSFTYFWVGVALVGFLFAAGWILKPTPGAFEKLWAPFLNKGAVTQICVGEPNRLIRIDGLSSTENRVLYRRDALAATRVAAMVAAKGVSYRLRTTSDAPYSELKGSPLIAIGGFDPQHKMKLRNGYRFELRREVIDSTRYAYVLDTENRQKRDWRFPIEDMKSAGAQDYAIITKTMVSATEKPAIAIVGLTDFSTLAAAEFMTNRESVSAAFRTVPDGWDRKNLQIVIETSVIQDVPGQTKAVAVHVW